MTQDLSHGIMVLRGGGTSPALTNHRENNMTNQAAAVKQDAPEATEVKPTRKMADVLRAARVSYKTTKAYSGKQSLNNGDEFAKALAGKTPAQTMAAAEAVHKTFDPDNVPDLKAKYGKLNAGQQRMNSGNRIRAAVKRGDITIAAAIKLIKKAK